MKWNSPPPYHLLSPFGMTAFYQPTLCYEAVKPRTASPQRMGHPRHRVGQKRKAEAWGTRRLVDSAAEDVARHQVATGIRFFDQIRSVVQVHAVPLLNSPPKRVIFESYRGLIR